MCDPATLDRRIRRTGSGHELFPDGLTFQGDLAWSPDGTRLLYSDDGKLYLTDASGSSPQPVNTGCAAPCTRDSQVAFSSDGTRLVFMRESADASGYVGPTVIATMDLATGRVVELRSTGWDGTAAPGWSPDGKQILFFRFGEGDSGGPVAPRLSAVWLVDADGQNLRQVSPTTLAAEYPEWSPDGARILFESPDGERHDVYTIRPDGTDVRRLTTDGISTSASWTPDGRIPGCLHDPPGRDRRASADDGRDLDLGIVDARRTDPSPGRRSLSRLVDDGRRWHERRQPCLGRRGRRR